MSPRILPLAAVLAAGPAAAEVLRYDEFTMLGRRHAAAYADLHGTVFGETIVVPRSPTVSEVHYREPGSDRGYYERFELKDNPATRSKWWFVTHYCSVKPRFCDTIRTTSATITIGEQTFDISRPEIEGQPYAPQEFSAPYTLRVAGFSEATPFLWWARMEHVTAVKSDFWPGGATQSALRQQEAWWDEVRGWEGNGSETQPSRTQWSARGAGIGYLGEINGWRFGVRYAWSH